LDQFCAASDEVVKQPFEEREAMKSPVLKLLSISLLAILLAATTMAAQTTAKLKVTGMECKLCQARSKKL
jgi:hypothetical protein